VTIWQQTIAVYRDTNGQIHALENVCPHKGVALHSKVQGCHLACGYHGWNLTVKGALAFYLPKEQKLPAFCPQLSSPGKYNLIWIFPGDPSLATTCQPPDISEFDQPDWLMVPIIISRHISLYV